MTGGHVTSAPSKRRSVPAQAIRKKKAMTVKVLAAGDNFILPETFSKHSHQNWGIASTSANSCFLGRTRLSVRSAKSTKHQEQRRS